MRAAVSDLVSWAAAAKARVGAVVLDVPSGAVLASSGEHTLLNPASNTKVLTAAVVLDRMGPDYVFSTGVYGTVKDGVVAPLVLRGNGDPSLTTETLWEFARALQALGVHRVDGLLVDQSYFDGQWVPPAFASQPNEWAPFRAPVSAVSLERNSVTLNVAATRAGSPAAAWFDPPGFVDVHGTIETRRAGVGDGVRLTLTPKGSRLSAEVAGYIGEGSPRVRFGKRVDDPRSFAGYALREVLRLSGIEVTGDVQLGGKDVTNRLAHVESAPLAVLVRELGKNSDNFYAETLLKALGAFTHGPPARTEDGADAVLSWLAEMDAREPGMRMTNGSGLFDANRVSALSLATVLRRAYLSPRIGPDFVSELAVGGVDGTLRSRFKKEATRRIVRAKTGTLDGVIALSGYVFGPFGASPVAFSFIADGVTGKHAEARQKIDRCVEAIASSLWDR